MLIAVTGAGGFIGGRAVVCLARQGHELLAYGRRPEREFAHRDLASYRRWDITSGPIAAPAVDAVVHCAGEVADWGPLARFDAANVGGTRAVLETFRRAAQVIHVSTASVYDPLSSRVGLREDAPYPDRYLNAYSRTKMLAEQVVLQSGRNAAVLRPHAVYGPGDRTLLPRLLHAYRGDRLFIVGDGRNLLSLTHVDNLVQAMTCALERPACCGIFNVADPVAATLDAVLRHLLLALGRRPIIVHIPRSLAWPLACALERAYGRVSSGRGPLLTRYRVAQLADACTLDITKAQQMLGYRPEQTYLTGGLGLPT